MSKGSGGARTASRPSVGARVASQMAGEGTPAPLSRSARATGIENVARNTLARGNKTGSFGVNKASKLKNTKAEAQRDLAKATRKRVQKENESIANAKKNLRPMR